MPTDPNIAFLFLAAGLIGIYAEFCFPGTVIPGAAGGVLFLLGFAGFVEMGVRRSAVCFVAAGFVLLAAEVFLHTRWALAAAGVILIAAGSSRLHEGLRPVLAAPVAGALAVITAVLLCLAVRASANKNHKEGVVFWHSDDIFSSVGVIVPKGNGTQAGGIEG
jgi:membrane-bound ClpP family serine protease